MLRQAVRRGLLGIPIGIAVTYVITIIISAAIGDGYFHPVVPALSEQFGNEINAVVFQTALSGLLYGAGVGAASVIWNIEKWSIAKQTGIFFIVLSAVALPTAYFAHWMPRTATGFLLYIVIFIALYIAVCAINYLIWRAQIKKMNEKIPR
jgi:purine-cytosine permease-like protein